MNQLNLSKWLKAVIIGIGICGTVIYFYVFPTFGKHYVALYPEFLYCYLPWLIYLWISAIPCYITLVCGWKIADEIGNNNSFSNKNSNLLKLISILSGSYSAFIFIGNIIFLFLNMNHITIAFLSIIVAIAGTAVSITTAALSNFVFKAVQINEENQLTI